LKNYNTIFEFIIGLFGVVIHTIIVTFIVAYKAMPGSLEAIIETTSGEERILLEQFISDVNDLSFMVYFGSAIVIFEWIAIFRILKHSDRCTPIWTTFLILGALYAFFYFGGLEVFILLMASALITLTRYFLNKKKKSSLQ